VADLKWLIMDMHGQAQTGISGGSGAENGPSAIEFVDWSDGVFIGAIPIFGFRATSYAFAAG
jgi:hypothetical protein